MSFLFVGFVEFVIIIEFVKFIIGEGLSRA